MWWLSAQQHQGTLTQQFLLATQSQYNPRLLTLQVHNFQMMQSLSRCSLIHRRQRRSCNRGHHHRRQSNRRRRRIRTIRFRSLRYRRDHPRSATQAIRCIRQDTLMHLDHLHQAQIE